MIAARRLFVFRCVELGWTVLYTVLRAALSLLHLRGGLFSGLDATVELIFTVLCAVQVGLLVGLRREVGAHPAAGLLRASVALAAVDLVTSAVIAVAGLLGTDAWTAIGLGRMAPNVFFLLLTPAFDVVFWLALERLLGRVSPLQRGAFFALRLLSLGMSSLFLVLPFETYRSLLLTGAFALAYPVLRVAFSVGWNATVLVALDRLARSAPLTAGVTADHDPGSDGGRDLLVGALWLGGGLAVTLATVSAAAAGGGGRYVVTTGAIVYGAMRIVRGLTRRSGR